MGAYRGTDFREPRKGLWHHLWCEVHRTLLSWAGQVFKGLVADFMSPQSLELS